MTVKLGFQGRETSTCHVAFFENYWRYLAVLCYNRQVLRGERDQQRIVNHISKEPSKIKTPQHSFALLRSPAVGINHALIFPACHQGLSAQALEPSLWHPSDLSLSCECTLQLKHFRIALRFGVIFKVQNSAEISFVGDEFERSVAKMNGIRCNRQLHF